MGFSQIGQAVASLVQSPQQLTATSKDLSERRARSAKYARLLLGCYRSGEANDPEVYTAAIITIIAEYPEDVVRRVVDPRIGLPSKIKWLPTPKEVHDACEELDGQDRRLREWEVGAAAQLAERQRLDDLRGVTVKPRYSAGRANVLVRKELPLYRTMMERAADADPKDFQYDATGIWVNESWIKGAKFT